MDPSQAQDDDVPVPKHGLSTQLIFALKLKFSLFRGSRLAVAAETNGYGSGKTLSGWDVVEWESHQSLVKSRYFLVYTANSVHSGA